MHCCGDFVHDFTTNAVLFASAAPGFLLWLRVRLSGRKTKAPCGVTECHDDHTPDKPTEPHGHGCKHEH